MIDIDALNRDLTAAGLSQWQRPIRALISERLKIGAHGDLQRWRDTVASINSRQSTEFLSECLLALAPWRKGPFDVADIHIDSEWRSDMKWNRICPHWSSLDNRNILDVGCGNGYYARRLRQSGARFVLGIDPGLLFLAQFAAIQKLDPVDNVHVIPARLEDMPAASHAFDKAISMGVLYHRRDPLLHLRELHDTLKTGGELVLETLILPGDEKDVLTPDDRYARMRNVWHLPTLTVLQKWLQDAGFADTRVIDVTRTTTNEQRTTKWMPFESLREALDPDDPSLTVEGLPAPTRAAMIAVAA